LSYSTKWLLCTLQYPLTEFNYVIRSTNKSFSNMHIHILFMNGNINRQSWRQPTQTLVNLYHNQILHQQLAESVIANASQIIIPQHIINVPDIPAKLNLWYNWGLQSSAKCLSCLEICVRGLPPINVQFQHLNENPLDLAQTIFNLHQQTQWPCRISSKNSYIYIIWYFIKWPFNREWPKHYSWRQWYIKHKYYP